MGLRSGAVNGGAFVKMDDTGLGSKEFTSEDLVLRVVHAVVRSKKNQFTLIAQNRSPGTAGILKSKQAGSQSAACTSRAEMREACCSFLNSCLRFSSSSSDQSCKSTSSLRASLTARISSSSFR